MSVDTILYPLSTLELYVQRNRSEYLNPDNLLARIGVLRDSLRKDDAEQFTRDLDRYLATAPDSADYILENLYEELKIETREEFDALLLE